MEPSLKVATQNLIDWRESLIELFTFIKAYISIT